MQKEISKEEIQEFLDENRLAILSTVNEEGLPDAAPIYYYPTNNFEVLFVTPNKTKKFKNIIQNNHIILTIVKESTREIVQIKGIASEEPKIEIEEMISKLADRVNTDSDFITVLPLLSYKKQEKKIMKITPVSIRMRRFTEKGIEEKEVNTAT